MIIIIIIIILFLFFSVVVVEKCGFVMKPLIFCVLKYCLKIKQILNWRLRERTLLALKNLVDFVRLGRPYRLTWLKEDDHSLSVWCGLYLLKYLHLYSMSHLKLLCIHFVKIFIKCFVKKKKYNKSQFILLCWINTVKRNQSVTILLIHG